MQGNRNRNLLVLTLAATLVLVACNKNPEQTTPPAGNEAPAPMAPASDSGVPPPAPANSMPAPAPLTVTSVQLGSAVGPDQQITAPTTTFAPKDTIYAAVSTTGTASNATLAAKWTYQDGQTVNESSQTIAPTGPATTTFHIAKPDGWPAGNYKVEISLNGTMAMSKDFTVE
ncbi:MAG: hypothetical protein WBW61_00040 [Rhodanobacteraceae bacterium]